MTNHFNQPVLVEKNLIYICLFNELAMLNQDKI